MFRRFKNQRRDYCFDISISIVIHNYYFSSDQYLISAIISAAKRMISDRIQRLFILRLVLDNFDGTNFLSHLN